MSVQTLDTVHTGPKSKIVLHVRPPTRSVLHRVRCGGSSPTHSGGVGVRRPLVCLIYNFQPGANTFPSCEYRVESSCLMYCVPSTQSFCYQ